VTRPAAANPASDQISPDQISADSASGGQNSAELPAREWDTAELEAAECGRAGRQAGREVGLSDRITWLIAASVFAAYTLISMTRYLRRDPTSWDLGIFTEYVKRYADLRAPIVDIRGAGFNLLGDHFHLMGASTKLPTLAMILLPTAFIAVRSPLALAALPSLGLRFIGTNPAYWSTDWHYNATVMPILFIAAIDAVARLRATSALPGEPARAGGLALAVERHGAAAMLALCAGLAFQFPLSYLWTPSTYILGPHVTAENEAMAIVPTGATVATDLDLLAPLAARTDTFWLGNLATNPPTQYVVFDNESSDFPPQANALNFIGSVIQHARYRLIFSDNNVYVFRRIS
jgi:uncharacterized membrane protein